jgi:hypothetical protein
MLMKYYDNDKIESKFFIYEMYFSVMTSIFNWLNKMIKKSKCLLDFIIFSINTKLKCFILS